MHCMDIDNKNETARMKKVDRYIDTNIFYVLANLLFT